MAALPTGTVTLLFTDIEGSTRLLQELGRERYVEALSAHRRLLRKAFASHGGVEVEMQGDSFHFAFASAKDAVAAASEGQRALAAHDWKAEPIRVRIGLHTGEPVAVDNLYAGLDVHRAARVMSAAHGGQVVLSEQTRSFLDDGFELRDLGLHKLKDLTEPEKLFQLGDGDFPPLRSLNATNLPTQPSLLIGRERELTELRPLVRERRLVTLTGAGGSGKTRLALQLAAELVAEFADGVFWVPLAALRDPELVLPTIAQTLGAKIEFEQHVAEKRLLLLLDNLEQLLDAAPRLSDLVKRCPNLHLLVTSRAPLRIAGEREYEVEPLLEADALTLFRERAVVTEPEEAVREICRRLDRLPLAIELAAARTRILPPDKLLERLEQRLPLLTGGPRDLPERQRALRATIEWSHDLLSPEEQRLFARLAVFAGSFGLEAAEVVCDVDLDVLESLIEQNLVRRWGSGRLGMLETIRELALEKLEQSGEAEEFRRRHAEFFLALIEQAEPGLTDARQVESLERLQPEHDNVRAALVSAGDRGNDELILRLVGAFCWFWYLRGHFHEGRRWLERALSNSEGLATELRAKALYGATVLAHREGDLERARALAAEHLALSGSLSDRGERAKALVGLGQVAQVEGEPDEATDFYLESAALAREFGDRWTLSVAVINLGDLALSRGDYAAARPLFEEALELQPDPGYGSTVATSLANLGTVAFLEGDEREARQRYEQSLDVSQMMEEKESLIVSLEGLGSLAARGDDVTRAARLLGAAERLREETGLVLPPTEHALHLATVDAIGVDPEESAAWAEGRAMSSSEATAYALEAGERV